MKTILVLLLLGIVVMSGLACAEGATAPEPGREAGPATLVGDKSEVPDSRQMEKDLQRLPWPRFRAIVEAVPKLRAGIEAYGTAGWQIVEANYTRYRWQKNIDKLDEAQKKQLADLIAAAKTAP